MTKLSISDLACPRKSIPLSTQRVVNHEQPHSEAAQKGQSGQQGAKDREQGSQDMTDH